MSDRLEKPSPGKDPSEPKDASKLVSSREELALDVPELMVEGDFVDEIVIVSNTAAALLLGIGRTRDYENAFLLPYLEFKMSGSTLADSQEEETDPLFSRILTFDNAAFVIMDFASDIRAACGHIRALRGSELSLEPARMRQARAYLQNAQAHITASLRALEESTI
jgi:hypothetical protein